MRRFFSIDTWLQLLGSMAKCLFAAMFVSTVLVLLIAAFGATEAAVMIFRVIWFIFWRACSTLMALIAITTLLGIWSPKQSGFSASMLQEPSSRGSDNIINFQRHHFRKPKTGQKPQS